MTPEQKINEIADTMTRSIMGDTKQALNDLNKLLPIMGFAPDKDYNKAFKEMFNAIHEQLHNLNKIAVIKA